jgi:hypothetical protein
LTFNLHFLRKSRIWSIMVNKSCLYVKALCVKAFCVQEHLCVKVRVCAKASVCKSKACKFQCAKRKIWQEPVMPGVMPMMSRFAVRKQTSRRRGVCTKVERMRCQDSELSREMAERKRCQGKTRSKWRHQKQFPPVWNFRHPACPGEKLVNRRTQGNYYPIFRETHIYILIIWRRKVQSSLISEICGSSSMEVPGLLFCCWPPCRKCGVGRASRFKHSLKSTWRSLTHNPCT